MKKLFASSLFALLLCVSVSAQVDKTVEPIRKRYVDIAEKARLCETDDEQGQTGPLIMNELTINARDHQWRAVGKYEDKYRFFYTGGDDEKNLYPDKLVLVKRADKISDRPGTEEYLFDEAGRLVFHKQNYVHHENGPTLREIYFSSLQKPFRIVENGKTRDKLSPLDLDVAKDIVKVSEKLKELFARSINL